MVPLVELRGAMIYAAVAEMPFLPSLICCILGNILPVPFLIKFAKTVLVCFAKIPKIGFILGFPVINQDFFTTAVQEKWNMDLFTPQSILDTESGKWVVISDNSSSKITVAAVEQESYFLFSDTVKILLLACIFISIYLIFFLLFNLKQDSMVVIKHKIKKQKSKIPYYI